MNQSAVKPSEGDTSRWYVDSFKVLESGLNGAASAPFHKVRQQALKSLSEKGFPTTRNEEWKYTDVAAVRRAPYTMLAGTGEAGEIEPLLDDAWRIVFVNGFFRKELSDVQDLPAGVYLSSIAAELHSKSESVAKLAQLAGIEEHAFLALNTAFFRDGLLLSVAEGVEVERPFEVVYLTAPGGEREMAHSRLLVIGGQNCSFSLVENHTAKGAAEYMHTAVSEFAVGADSRIDHYRVVREGPKGQHFSYLHAHQERGANFRTHCFNFSGALVRNDVRMVLDGPGIETTLNGLSVLEGSEHADNHTVLDHAQPQCLSHELYKGIYADRSKGVFNGTIIVREGAQKTNAIQSNQSLLLSEDATIDAKPQLKIWADDVKCTHGATIGQIDEDALFYIRSRGVAEKDARNMLVHAFASEITKEVRIGSLQRELEALLMAKLDRIQLVK